MRLVKLSAKEAALLALIPKDGSTIDTAALLAAYYGEETPDNGQVIITGRLRSIGRKLDRLAHPFQLIKSERRGPHPVRVWLRPRS